jgi:hypothetical protein
MTQRTETECLEAIAAYQFVKGVFEWLDEDDDELVKLELYPRGAGSWYADLQFWVCKRAECLFETTAKTRIEALNRIATWCDTQIPGLRAERKKLIPTGNYSAAKIEEYASGRLDLEGLLEGRTVSRFDEEKPPASRYEPEHEE